MLKEDRHTQAHTGTQAVLVSFSLLGHTPKEANLKGGRFLAATGTGVCSGSPGFIVWPVLSYGTVVGRVQWLSCRGMDKVDSCRASPK